MTGLPTRDRPYVLDVSRLLWRLGGDRLPTGIDRVCQAYLEALAPRSLALVQWRNLRLVMHAGPSERLFRLLASGARRTFRLRLALLIVSALLRRAVSAPDVRDRFLLNVGHTGLNAPGLVEWLARSGMKPVYLIHDLIPITHPEYCRAGEDARHAQRMRQALRSAAGIIANSVATREELARFAECERLAMPPTTVAHLGIEPLSRASHAAPRRRPYFLCIGTIEGRKNHALLLRVWKSLRRQMGVGTPELVLVGRRGWMADEVFAELDQQSVESGPNGNGKVVELSHCDDRELAALIAHCRAVLMPSHIEGYGLPVLEAMMLGAPVIANNLAVYREIAGDVPLLLDVGDDAAWIEAIAAYTGDNGDRNRQIDALATFSPPTWQQHIAMVEEWLRSL